MNNLKKSDMKRLRETLDYELFYVNSSIRPFIFKYSIEQELFFDAIINNILRNHFTIKKLKCNMSLSDCF